MFIKKLREPENNLVTHARREMAMAKVEPEEAEKIIEMVKVFSSMGHSGSSAPYFTSMLLELLSFNNLTDLTDHPDEWIHHGKEISGVSGGLWQNIRNSGCFSQDGGRTYWKNDDPLNTDGETPRYSSKHVELPPKKRFFSLG